MSGRFVTFEGIDGAGKSTQLALALAWADARGIDHVATREPGGTPLGEELRAILLDAGRRMDPESELLLMFAARNEHLAEVIRPALVRGQWVFCDRFTDATYAYQGGGRGLPAERIAALETWVQGSLQPDVTLLFDVDPALGHARRSGREERRDRFEAEATAFHARVREAYLDRARASGGRVVVIDASRPPGEVQALVEAVLGNLAGDSLPHHS